MPDPGLFSIGSSGLSSFSEPNLGWHSPRGFPLFMGTRCTQRLAIHVEMELLPDEDQGTGNEPSQLGCCAGSSTWILLLLTRRNCPHQYGDCCPQGRCWFCGLWVHGELGWPPTPQQVQNPRRTDGVSQPSLSHILRVARELVSQSLTGKGPLEKGRGSPD